MRRLLVLNGFREGSRISQISENVVKSGVKEENFRSKPKVRGGGETGDRDITRGVFSWFVIA